MNDPLRLIQDLQEAGIVKGGQAAKQARYRSPRAEVQALDPQDQEDVTEAFQRAHEALVALGETLLKVGPPSSLGASEMLTWLRQQLSEVEQALGLPEDASSD